MLYTIQVKLKNVQFLHSLNAFRIFNCQNEHQTQTYEIYQNTNTTHLDSGQDHVLHHSPGGMVEGNVLDHHFQDRTTLAGTTSNLHLYPSAETSNQLQVCNLEAELKQDVKCLKGYNEYSPLLSNQTFY